MHTALNHNQNNWSSYFHVTPYQPREDEPSTEELAQIFEDARQALELDPPSACVEWWSALSVAVQHKWLADRMRPANTH